MPKPLDCIQVCEAGHRKEPNGYSRGVCDHGEVSDWGKKTKRKTSNERGTCTGKTSEWVVREDGEN
jgi:hypothetical protein